MTSLEEIAVCEFDLDLTLRCGQVFHWQPLGRGYTGVVGTLPVYVEHRGGVLLATKGSAAALHHYFSLDHPLQQIYASFPADPAMDAALAGCQGLRIIRQPLWECLATFITSALKQVAHIAAISHRLRECFGELVGEIAGRALFAYPAIERIAGLQEAELRACGLGFRAVSLLATAKHLMSMGSNDECYLETLRPLSRTATLAALTEFRGVGTKVANCVLLFGYEHLDAFPIDVWIERVLRETYFLREPGAPLATLQRFSEQYFGQYGGYAQQYLFHHARMTKGKKSASIPTQEAGAPIRRVRVQSQRRRGHG